LELTGLFVCYVCTVIQIYPIYLLFAFLQQALELFGNWSWVLQKQLNSGSFWKPPLPFWHLANALSWTYWRFSASFTGFKVQENFQMLNISCEYYFKDVKQISYSTE